MPIKFLAGSPVTVTFKFDKGMEKDGQWGKYYSYGVTHEGKDDYMSVSEGSTLLSYLNSISPLKGKTVTIEKKEQLIDGKPKPVWYVDGKSLSQPANQKEFGEAIKQASQMTGDEIKEIFAELGSLKSRVDKLEEMTGANGVPF